MRQLSWLLLCWWSLVGCASDGAGEGVRHARGAEDSEAPAIFLPVELLEWGGWSDEALEKVDRVIYLVMGSPELIQRIILEVYSKYPIPQLIGITP